MEKTLYELRTFHLTGRKIDKDFTDLGGLDLVPALLSRYRDLTQIRYDYPLVLVEGGGDSYVQSLASITNGILQAIAPEGIEGERARKNLLNLEMEMRSLSAAERQRHPVEALGGRRQQASFRLGPLRRGQEASGSEPDSRESAP